MMKSIGPIDVDDEYGGTVTLPAVVGEGIARNGGSNRRIHDAADEERKSAMRAFFKTACAEGLDCKAADRMRREISYWLGRPIYSRRDVRAGEWIELQTALLVSLAW